MTDDVKAKAVQAVVSAWTVEGPYPLEHVRARAELMANWPKLAVALNQLDEAYGTGWEYNIETTKLETGEKSLSLRWVEDSSSLVPQVQNLRKLANVNVEYGGELQYVYKIVKRRKPEGYVDA